MGQWYNVAVDESSNLSVGFDSAGTDTGRLSRRTARWVWIIGGFEMASCGFLSGSLFRLWALPAHQKKAVLQGALEPNQVEQMAGQIWPMATASLIFGFIPGLTFVFLGFGIRRKRWLPTGGALILSAVQSAVLCLLIGAALLGALRRGAPANFTLAIVLLGTPAAILGLTARSLFRLMPECSYRRKIETDPWR